MVDLIQLICLSIFGACSLQLIFGVAQIVLSDWGGGKLTVYWGIISVLICILSMIIFLSMYGFK